MTAPNPLDPCGPFHCRRCARGLVDIPLIRVSAHGAPSVWECIDCYPAPGLVAVPASTDA